MIETISFTWTYPITMTTNFMLLNKLICNRHAYFAITLLTLATAANPLYVLTNFIAIVANAFSANQN